MDKESVEINKVNVNDKKAKPSVKCFNCGEIGHFQSKCPNNNRFNSRQFRQQNRYNNRNEMDNGFRQYKNANEHFYRNQSNNQMHQESNYNSNFGQNQERQNFGNNNPNFRSNNSHSWNQHKSPNNNFNSINQNWPRNNYNQNSNQFSMQFNHSPLNEQAQVNMDNTHEVRTFGQSSDSLAFNFISLNPVTVKNNDWTINKAHPLMKVSSHIRLYSDNVDTHTDLLVDNGASNSLLRFSSLPSNFKQVIQNFCRLNDNNPDLKKHSVGIKTCNSDSFTECVVARVWLTIGSWSGEHQFIITDSITNVDGILGRDFLLQYETIIDNKNDTLRINNTSNRTSINSCDVSNPAHMYFVQTTTLSNSCYVSHKQKIPKDCESILEIKFEQENFKQNIDVLFEPVKMDSVILAHSINRVENNKMWISALNLSGEDFEIDSSLKLGSISIVESVDVNLNETKSSVSNPNQAKSNFKEVEIKSKIDQIKLDESLEPNEVQEVKNLIYEFNDCFSWNENDIGRTNVIKHQINTNDNKPIKQNPYRVPSFMRNEIDKEVEKMIENKIIQESNSPWASPVVMVKKKNGSFRFCIDYRKLNKITEKDSFPIPHVDDTLQALDGAKYFTVVDLTSGYWQVEIEASDVPKTAFVTSSGLFEFLVMPFGLTNAPATFQRLMNRVLKGQTMRQCVVYLDDIIVFSKTFEEHLLRLRNVFERLRQANLKIQPNKCRFGTNKVIYLGFELSKDGFKPDPNKTQAIEKMESPIDADQLKRFMGSINFYRRFIAYFCQIASPLYRLLGKSVKFVWTQICEAAFNELKNKLVSAPILIYPDFSQKFFIHCDASNESSGAVLSQLHEGVYKPIAFASHRLSPAEKTYTTSEKEALAALRSLKEFNSLIYGREVELFTDHQPLSTFKSIKDPSSRLTKLMMKIRELAPDVVITYKPGHLNKEADMLSRANINQLSLNSYLNWSIEQNKDQDLVELKSLLKNGDESLKNKWIKSDELFKKRAIRILDKLVIDTVNFESESKLIFVPKHKIPEVLKSFHDDPISGHLGFEKTLKRLKIRFFWFDMKKHTKEYCESCLVCQQFRVPNSKSVASLQQIVANYPFEIIGIDVVGPLPTTPRGMKYIIVAICYYSKWCEALATKDFTAQTTAMFIINCIICRFGFMSKIITDQGPNFESNVVKELCKGLKIEKLRTTAYHPQGNGEVERQNRTLKAVLSKYVNTNHTDWDTYLNSTLFAYNTAVHSSTG